MGHGGGDEKSSSSLPKFHGKRELYKGHMIELIGYLNTLNPPLGHMLQTSFVRPTPATFTAAALARLRFTAAPAFAAFRLAPSSATVEQTDTLTALHDYFILYETYEQGEGARPMTLSPRRSLSCSKTLRRTCSPSSATMPCSSRT
jgi:hypothetical protein